MKYVNPFYSVWSLSVKYVRQNQINCFLFLKGDDGCGKTSLITKLRDPGDEQIQKGSGLEFTFINVHDEERDGKIELQIKFTS